MTARRRGSESGRTSVSSSVPDSYFFGRESPEGVQPRPPEAEVSEQRAKGNAVGLWLGGRRSFPGGIFFPGASGPAASSAGLAGRRASPSGCTPFRTPRSTYPR